MPPFATFSCRPLSVDDVPAVAALWHEGWHDGHADFAPPELIATRTPELFLERAAESIGAAWVVEDGERVGGIGVLEDELIGHFYVDRRFRGTGAAERLMATLESALRSRGVARGRLDCADRNLRARRFYEKCGWCDGGIVHHQTAELPDGRPVPRIVRVFEKDLLPGDVHVRPFRSQDREAVVALWHTSWHDSHDRLLPASIVEERTRETFARRLDDLENDAFVAVRNSRIAGFGALQGDEVDQFFIDRSARGTGVAKLFLSVLEDALAARGVVDGHVECLAGNLRAATFYARCGWTRLGLLDRPVWTSDGRPEFFPLHRFTKRLGS